MCERERTVVDEPPGVSDEVEVGGEGGEVVFTGVFRFWKTNERQKR